jgi:uncharacterized protein (TIGR02646 family)
MLVLRGLCSRLRPRGPIDMILLNREKVPVPKLFTSRALSAQREKATEFYSMPASHRTQQRFEWATTIILFKTIRPHLSKITHGKCAYCERAIPSGVHFDHFRPRHGAIGLNGRTSPDHYWWLGFEWTNLVPTCPECNFTKGGRFPVRRRRAPVGSLGTELLTEEPLLLDPFVDNPEEHLVFTEAGNLVSQTERGEATIEVLALNRLALVDARAKHIASLRSALSAIAATDGQQPEQRQQFATTKLRSFLLPQSPHLGLTRQFLPGWANEFAIKSLLPEVIKAIRGGVTIWRARLLGTKRSTSKAEIEATQTQFDKRVRQKERHSVESEGYAAKTAYFSGIRRIEHIAIHNFKAIPDLEIDVPSPGTDKQSWLMLVGENGVGKSSILQAIALALMGQAHVSRMALDARKFVCHEGSDEGWVRVHLTNLSQPVELRFNRTDRHFNITPRESLVLLLGYGATRLLPRTVTRHERLSRYIRVRNLFNPYARLSNTERLLTDRARMDDARFGQAAWAIKKLLLLDGNDTVRRERRQVIIETSRFRASLMELSDGYQSVVALAGDIMAGVAGKWESIESAEGIVLIDEIEAHLHPFWKMQIVGRLRRVFPKLTFVVTTHDPLCLRGLLPGEILVLRRSKEEVVGTAVRESINHLRADQLLTSPLFGLAHTRDQSVEREIERCSELLGKAVRTTAEDAELRELQERLSSSLQVGETPTQRNIEQAMKETLTSTEPERLWGPLPEVSSVTVPRTLSASLTLRVASLKSSLQAKS